jgi:hypothetical protein
MRSIAAAPGEPSRWRRVVPAPELWPGNAVAGKALGELWGGYLVAAAAAKPGNVQRLQELTSAWNWWRELEAYHRRVPPLRVFLVSYPAAVVLVEPPDAAILGLGSFDAAILEGQLRQAAEALAAG